MCASPARCPSSCRITSRARPSSFRWISAVRASASRATRPADVGEVPARGADACRAGLTHDVDAEVRHLPVRRPGHEDRCPAVAVPLLLVRASVRGGRLVGLPVVDEAEACRGAQLGERIREQLRAVRGCVVGSHDVVHGPARRPGDGCRAVVLVTDEPEGVRGDHHGLRLAEGVACFLVAGLRCIPLDLRRR